MSGKHGISHMQKRWKQAGFRRFCMRPVQGKDAAKEAHGAYSGPFTEKRSAKGLKRELQKKICKKDRVRLWRNESQCSSFLISSL